MSSNRIALILRSSDFFLYRRITMRNKAVCVSLATLREYLWILIIMIAALAKGATGSALLPQSYMRGTGWITFRLWQSLSRHSSILAELFLNRVNNILLVKKGNKQNKFLSFNNLSTTTFVGVLDRGSWLNSWMIVLSRASQKITFEIKLSSSKKEEFL